MPRIALYTSHLQQGDAIGHDTLEMQAVLRAAGHEVRIFTPRAEPSLAAESPRRLAGFLAAPEDILLFHYAVADADALKFFQELQCRKVMKYHNVTPPEYFEPWHGGYADLCRRGRSMLREFVTCQPHLLIGDSEYNVKDLREAGASEDRCAVVPPFHAIEGLREREADLNLLQRFAPDAFGRTRNLLMVGRIVPNKGYEHLLRAFAVYCERYDPANTRLIFAGKTEDPLALYTAHLRRLCEDLGLELGRNVVFTDRISAAGLKSLFLTADLFTVLSEHEGFCVPVVEALAFGIPVVALDRGAVGETLGDAGLLWEENDPALFASSWQRVLGDADLAWELGQRGQARYQERFHNDRIAGELLRALEPLL